MRRTAALVLVLTACSGGAATTTQPSTTSTATVVAPTVVTTSSTTTTTPAPPVTAPAVTTTTISPPAPFDPLGATILEMQQAMHEGRLTSVDLVRTYLDRIAVLDPQLTVFVSINPNALDEALALDVERSSLGARGPLHGIPVVLKDNIATADLPTTAGSAALEGWIPHDDAFQVSRLRAAGAIILGKVNLQEWARSVHGNSSVLGRTLNPYDPTRNTGGSSAGTAVAVTTEMASVGLGTDTCGSIRIPAAFASLWGLRPTLGLSSRGGVIPLSSSEDTVGPMARSVSDLAVVLDATVGEDPDDPTTAGSAAHIPASYLDSLDPNGLHGARIGVVYSLFGSRGPVYDTVEAALVRMEAAGAMLVPIEVPNRVTLLSDATGVFLREWAAATETFFGARTGTPISSLDDVLASGLYLPETRDQLVRAVTVIDDSAGRARAGAARIAVAAAVTATMDEHDLDALAYPSISYSPAAVGVDQRGNNCATASVGGLPALSMPAGLTRDGLPVGVDFLGRAWDESTLLRLAAGYEAAVNPRVPPPQAAP
jgi:Asp-tRNA(Asn)/Glu-tRNA(Gln) amidotransferase A subunit family amidase